MREQAPSRGRLVGRYVVHDRIKLTLNAGQRVPVSFAAAIAAQALHGLHAAHEAHDRNGEPLGIIHRDVSPQNILVGIDGVSRVLDFGIAKAASRATATEDGQLKGKTAYMAPEQLQHGAVDRRTDIFAASIVLWELLCGRRLFFADSPAEMMSRVLTSPIENPQTYAPHVPPELAAITLRGLDRDPAGRFATAEEMALAIEDAVAIPRPKDIGAWVSTIAKLTLEGRAQLVQIVEASSHKMPAAQQTSDPVLAKAIEEAERRRENAEMATDVGGRMVAATDPQARFQQQHLVGPPRGHDSSGEAAAADIARSDRARRRRRHGAGPRAVDRARALERCAQEAAWRCDASGRRHRHRPGRDRGAGAFGVDQRSDRPGYRERAGSERHGIDHEASVAHHAAGRRHASAAVADQEMRHRLFLRCAGPQALQARMRGSLIDRIGRIGSVAAFSLVVLAASPALAQRASAKPAPAAKAACLAAHEEATTLLTQKKPHAAHDKFVACARSECPTVVRKECGDQLTAVEKDAPTVALEARDEAGADTTEVKVTMDGSPLAERLTGSAVDVEPGEHVFRFERADGKSIEQKILVVEGDKNRKVVADFASLVPRSPPGGGDSRPGTPHEPKKIPVLAYVAGGVGIIGLGGFTLFALTGKGAEKDLASSCNPNCTNDQLSSVKRDYLFADVSLVIGVVAVATAVILARHHAAPPWMPRIKVRASP
jgi:hypothetical protein